MHIKFVETTAFLTGSNGETTTLAYVIPRKAGRGGRGALRHARNYMRLRHEACQDIVANIRRIEGGAPASITAVEPPYPHAHALWYVVEGFQWEFPDVVVEVVDPQPTTVAAIAQKAAVLAPADFLNWCDMIDAVVSGESGFDVVTIKTDVNWPDAPAEVGERIWDIPSYGCVVAYREPGGGGTTDTFAILAVNRILGCAWAYMLAAGTARDNVPDPVLPAGALGPVCDAFNAVWTKSEARTAAVRAALARSRPGAPEESGRRA